MATALTPHTCSKTGSFLCSGDECGRTAAGVCDKDGCGINPFGTGSKDFYGPGKTVDTSKPFTVVTQFVGEGASSTLNSSSKRAGATVSEIRRLYVQNGKVIENAPVMSSNTAASSQAGVITQDFCTSHNASSFLRLGGMDGMAESLDRGMVLVFSIWNSNGDFMNWLDSGNAGPCANTSGDPKLILQQNPQVSVTFSNIRWGDIGTTFNANNFTTASLAGAVPVKTSGASTSTAVTGGASILLAILMAYLMI